MKFFLKTTCTVITISFLLHATTSSAFSIPFFDRNTKETNTAPSPTTTVSEKEIQRLTKTIEVIQSDYIKKVDDKTLMNNAINGMVMRLDPHSAFLDKEELSELEATVSGEFVGIGVELTTERGLLRIISPIIDSPAAKAGLKPGDLIIKVGDKLVQDMTVNEAIALIRGKPGTPVTLTILRKDETKPLVINVMREVIKTKAVQSKMLMPDFGYIRITSFQESAEKQVRDAIESLQKESQGHLKGLVLDLRNNPGGLLDVSAEIVNLFLDKNETARYHNIIVSTKGRIANENTSITAHDDDLIPNVPMIVLINGGSASASEIVAGALQDYKRALIMGTRSFGKGSVQTIIPIGTDSALKLTTALYYTPSGREIQARGIEPDVIVPELSVNEKQVTGMLDMDEANYDHYIENGTKDGYEKKAHDTEQNAQQASTVKLAKEDYQLYEALMMLKGMHALK